MGSWKTEIFFFYWFSAWDQGPISSSAWSNLHSCFSVPRRMPSLWGYSAFLVLLNSLVKANSTHTGESYVLINTWGCITCIEQVKIALQWKKWISLLPLLYWVWQGNIRTTSRPKDLFWTATHYHQGSGLCLWAGVLTAILKSRNI